VPLGVWILFLGRYILLYFVPLKMGLHWGIITLSVTFIRSVDTLNLWHTGFKPSIGGSSKCRQCGGGHPRARFVGLIHWDAAI